jgi:hypothetical protein
MMELDVHPLKRNVFIRTHLRETAGLHHHTLYTIHQASKQATNQTTIHCHFCRIASDFASDIANIAYVALLL